MSELVQNSKEKARLHEVLTWEKHHRVNFMHVDEIEAMALITVLLLKN